MTVPRTSLAVLACFIFATAASADERTFDLSILVEPSLSYNEYDGLDLGTGIGLGLGWSFGRRWGIELRALRNDGFLIEATSVHLGLRRVLGTSTPWRPFVVFGGSVEDADFGCGPAANCVRSTDLDRDFGFFAGGGVDWNFSERTALRFDGRFSIHGQEQLDDDLDLTVGLVFRF